MNSLRSIVCMTIRGYARKPIQNSRSQRKPMIPRKEVLYPDVNEDNYDPDDDYDDLNDNESDFSNVGQSYTEHMRESRYAKELLKKRIVARKYFKSNDPNFITWTEKDQIQSLHAQNSVEWTPEVLSESFPALPETIRRILRSKWLAKSVDSVVKHDQRVIDNWKSFRAGNLAIDPRLEEHLKKFKDRKIEIASLTKIAERFVKKPPVFPTPKSKLFSDIVKGHIEEKPQKEKNDQLQITARSDRNESFRRKSPASNMSKEHVTFDTFLEHKIDDFAGDANLSLENQLLLEEYKKKRSIAAFDNTDSTVVQSEVEEPSTAVTTGEPPKTMMKFPQIDIKNSSTETGVLEWKKKELSKDGEYPSYIKIPRAKANSGVTFRVQDRYYDSDGEFLYRIPGLTSQT